MHRNLKVKFLAALATVGAACAAMAAPVAVLNSSFENPTTAFFTPPGIITDWFQSTTNSGVFLPSVYPLAGAGFIAGVFETQTGYVNDGFISQTLSSTLDIGSYVLNVNVGDRADFDGLYTIELLAGTTVLGVIDQTNFAPVNDGWITTALNYTALAGDASLGAALGIRLGLTGGVQVNFDNVRLDFTAAIPEPGTLALVGLAVFALGMTGRRRAA